MRLEEQTAMIFVGAILRDDLNLCPQVATVFRIVVVGNNLDFFDGILTGSNNGCAAPRDAGHSYAVNGVVVLAVARATSYDLSAIFSLENAIGAAGAADRCSRQVVGSSTGGLRAVAKGTGSQLQKLEGVAAKRGQLLNLLGSDRSAAV